MTESMDSSLSSAIGRIADFRTQWRVLVETWPSATHFEGRFVFCADGAFVPPHRAAREGPPTLRGTTREDVIRAAYELPESKIRAVLHSLT
jgi:hypothetical protein